MKNSERKQQIMQGALLGKTAKEILKVYKKVLDK